MEEHAKLSKDMTGTRRNPRARHTRGAWLPELKRLAIDRQSARTSCSNTCVEARPKYVEAIEADSIMK